MSLHQSFANYLDGSVVRRILPAVMSKAGGLIKTIDTLCLAIFAVEIGAKHSSQRANFMRKGRKIFDFIIVPVTFVPGGQGLSVLLAPSWKFISMRGSFSFNSFRSQHLQW